jgi:membrane-associated phospholipid phosphatase
MAGSAPEGFVDGAPSLWRATDRVVFAALGTVALLAAVFHARVGSWRTVVASAALAALAYAALLVVAARRRSPYAAFVVRMSGLLAFFAFLNVAVAPLQLAIHGRWRDDLVLAAEEALFGVQPTVWMQAFVSRPLTEWMMFSYVVYLPLFVVVCVLLERRSGEGAAAECLLAMALANVACDLSFMLFPVAGPLPYIGASFTVPLDGWVFTWIGEALRQHAQFVGGTIPSPHCANATVMWGMAYLHQRPLFRVLTPVVLSLYVSTVYCRYHYLTDAVLGGAVGVLAVAVAVLWTRRSERRVSSVGLTA